MLSPDFVILTAIGYVGLLFLLAYASDALSARGHVGFLRSPLVYTLSISVYCTSWTFYGAAGTAARRGLEFLPIYMGPSLVFIAWWFILRKLIRISHSQRITSIADFLSSRFGKSNALAVLVTMIVVVVVTPYIALQLKAIAASIQAVSVTRGTGEDHLAALDEATLAFGIAVVLAAFTILFGTRNVDAREQHLGVVAAIAFEAVVKLIALLAVGVFVVYGANDGFGDVYARAVAAGVDIQTNEGFGSRWVAVLFLSACAVICLPRQFQITVVENSNENHLRTAGWAFPAYMLLMSIFTMPIALHGLATMPAGSNPDMFVLTLPMVAGQDALALLVFIGGFSSATSMIIVASIALSIMVSNHVVLPLMLRRASRRHEEGEHDIARLLLRSRRISIAGLLGLGFLYFRLTSASAALAQIGLISFAGVAQLLPAMLAALYWRNANVRGALAGISIGFVVWAWTLFLPSLSSVSPLMMSLLDEGPWGIHALRPQALFGMEGVDPLVHAVFWSLLLNTAALLCVSVATSRSVLERIQAALFVDVFRRGASLQPQVIRGSTTTRELFYVAERVLGWNRARSLFESAGLSRGTRAWQRDVSPGFIARLERELAGSIGSASAHILLTKGLAGDTVSLEEVMRIADETQQVIEYSHVLEMKSQELHTAAQKLQEANALLQELHRQKDDFLSQVSHEVRTPMTSIRSFAEILLSVDDLPPAQRQRFITTIHNESVRLTRLLDDILDLSALEQGERGWENVPVDAEEVLDQAAMVCEAIARKRFVVIENGPRAGSAIVLADAGRLSQVFINIISNAISYNDAAEPRVNIASRVVDGMYIVEISDNGPGIPLQYRSSIFEKFIRAEPGAATGSRGLGLGLNISRNIIGKLDGTVELARGVLPGACFRVMLPVAPAQAGAGQALRA
ncbi:MAG: sensor histidine kinase [Burkholderiaceae bacterium]|nr:sensor histidine kinase [Burkholderiaceae bacterium]MEB2318451.1 sensor histidine kinase [Pseudomonadota bacterium]